MFKKKLTLRYNITLKYGFTLIELLIVIAIIAILAAAVIIAINPGEQLAKARDATRERHVKALESALYVHYYDHFYFPNIPEGFTEICDTEKENPNCEGLVDLSSLVPRYMASIPKDPSGGVNENGTGYKVATRENEEVVIYAPLSEMLTASTGGLPGYYWSFDNSLTSSEGIEPETGYIATLRPNEGRFGGAVAIEEGTENLINDPVDPSKWNTTSYSDTDYGFVSHRFIENLLYGIDGYERTSKSTDYRGSLIFTSWNTPIEMSTSYTFTIYARALENINGARVTLNYQGADSEGTRKDVTAYHYFSDSEWKRIEISATPSDHDFSTIIGHMKIYLQSINGENATIQVVMPQMEKKPFQTSFVEDTRGGGSLKYKPSTMNIDLNEDEWTIAGWVNYQEYWVSGNGRAPLLELGEYYQLGETSWTICPRNGSNRLSLVIYANRTDEHLSSSIYYDSEEIKEWIFVVLKKMGDNSLQMITFSKNSGKQSAEIISESWKHNPIRDNIYIGTYGWNSPINGLIDEIRIIPYALSEEEIQSLYVQTKSKYLAEKD